GVSGFIFPDVRSSECARELAIGVRYPVKGLGKRGVGLGRGTGFGRDFESYFSGWNESVVVIPQIEHYEAVEAVEAIAAIEGVDALFVGPYDLSASMGIAGDLDNARVLAALKRIVSAARDAGKAAGFHAVPPDIEPALQRLAEGARFLAFSG